jgi:hypothetical protein
LDWVANELSEVGLRETAIEEVLLHVQPEGQAGAQTQAAGNVQQTAEIGTAREQ